MNNTYSWKQQRNTIQAFSGRAPFWKTHRSIWTGLYSALVCTLGLVLPYFILHFDLVHLHTMKTSLLFFPLTNMLRPLLNQSQVLTGLLQMKLSLKQIVILRYIVAFVLCFCTELSVLCNLLFVSLLWSSKLCCLVLEGTNKLTFVLQSSNSSNLGCT